MKHMKNNDIPIPCCSLDTNDNECELTSKEDEESYNDETVAY